MHQPMILVDDDNRSFLAQHIPDLDGQPAGWRDRSPLEAQVPALDCAFDWVFDCEPILEAHLGMGKFPIIFLTVDDDRQTGFVSRIGTRRQKTATDEPLLATIDTLRAGHDCSMSEAV